MKGTGFDNIESFPQIQEVRKRDGSLVKYDSAKVMQAIRKAMVSSAEGKADEDSMFIARNVESSFRRAATLLSAGAAIPTVEQVSDAIERELMLHGYTRTAKAFILYREERAKLRAQEAEIPADVKKLVDDSRGYFRNSLAEFVYYRTYSRWDAVKLRRETWIETVDRYMSFMREKLETAISVSEYEECRRTILNMEVMPSMRLMWSAGAAARKTNVAAFNCAFVAPTTLKDFADILYILACGTGMGFGVESRNVQELPVVRSQKGGPKMMHIIEDSKEGWADSLLMGMELWYDGEDVVFDYSQLRPEGARLVTMGGRSSGPKPLMELHAFVRRVILGRQGRRLTNLDVHDIICKIGDCIVAGGVRRSALISLSDLDDTDLRACKEGHFYISNPQRMLANNSAVYNERPTDEQFLSEWLSLIKSRSGERGIFNRGSLVNQVPERRLKHWKEVGHAQGYPDADVDIRITSQVGTNPCGEITLLSRQFCNLTEVVAREDDTLNSLMRKTRVAALLGTYQSTLTYYPYISPVWQVNCERERLLGVSITGQWDCPEFIRDKFPVDKLRDMAIKTNKLYADIFGIPQSMSVTCVKPSGTVSQLVDSSSGMHARYAPFYIRRVRISSSDPLFRMLKDQGLPFYPEVGQTMDSATTFVFEFPIKGPNTVFGKDQTAMDQLLHWQKMKLGYTEHNPSVTVSVRDNEWLEVANWIRLHWDDIGGLSFLPADDHVYQLAPYEEITEEKYNQMLKAFEGVDYSRIVVYEKEDNTEGSKELACVAGVCELP